jgi:hypothetical protein
MNKLVGKLIFGSRVAVASLTRGIVGDTTFAVLPSIQPWHTFALTLLCQLVSIYTCYLSPSIYTIY